MASVHVVRRTTAAGKARYLVRYRLGGREAQLLHGGTFDRREFAAQRAATIRTALANGEVPDLNLLEKLGRIRTLDEVAKEYMATRIDVSLATMRVYQHAARHFGSLGRTNIDRIDVDHVQMWVTRLHAEEDLAPSTIRKYLDFLRASLDFAPRDPNPARSHLLRLPKQVREEINPLPYVHFVALCTAIVPRFNLHIRVMEATGLRIAELLSVTWADVDVPGTELRVARKRTKGGTAGRRMAQVWPEIMEEIAALVPVEDRVATDTVFAGTDKAIRNAMSRACKFAQILAYSPHDLRHRWISLRMMAGWPPHVVARQAGHSRASVTLDIYSHVMLDEPDFVMERIRGDASVMPRPQPVPGQNTEGPANADPSSESGRYWARTSDPQLVELVLSQLS